MKKEIIKKILVVLLLIIQILQITGNYMFSRATIKEGEIISLETNHECNSLLEYWMEEYQKLSYKIVWYVYYIDNEDGKKYPAFCVEPKKKGVGTGYETYDAIVKKEDDNRIWRILNKGYMGSDYKSWNLECDDDFYSATKIALHSLAEGISPKDKYILGTRSVDGNTVEEIQRRGEKVLQVAQSLYEYGINGKEVYQLPKASIIKNGEISKENIQDEEYYIQNYKISTNKMLKSYEVNIKDFPEGTKILNSKNQEQEILSNNSFKIAIPINKIKQDINGKINIENVYIKTDPVFYLQSLVPDAQSYVTYTSGYEKTNTSTTLQIKANDCKLTIEKLDKETKEPIANVVFEVKDENGKNVQEIKTNEKGIAVLENMYPNKVVVKEKSVPEPYILSNEEKEVTLKLGENIIVTFENEKIKGKIKILKISQNDNLRNGKPKSSPIENVVFEIRTEDKILVDTITTDKEGIAISKELEKGKYIIKEIKTDNDYILNEQENIIEIVEDKKQEEIIITNLSKEPNKPKLPRTGF